MGIFWEWMQEEELEEQRSKSESLEERVEQLETDLNPPVYITYVSFNNSFFLITNSPDAENKLNAESL
jgi:hypothetical protein